MLEQYNRVPVRFIKYSFPNGPGNVVDHGGILEINCQAWGHRRLAEEFGINLPDWMLSRELYDDQQFTRSVTDIGSVEPGAVFLFGPENLSDMRLLHWALYTGFRSRLSGEPLLEHANVIDKTVGIWPLSRFPTVKRYEKLFSVKQPVMRL